MKKYKQWLETVKSCTSSYNLLQKATSDARKAGCLDIDGPLNSAIWRAFDIMLDMVDDDTATISWHIYENQCGKRQYKCACNGKDYVIKNDKDIARFMVASKSKGKS